MNAHNRFFTQIHPQNMAKFNLKQRIRFAIDTRNCTSSIFGSKSCHVREAINAAADITLFDPRFRVCTLTRYLTNGICTRFHSCSLSRAFSNQCVLLNMGKCLACFFESRSYLAYLGSIIVLVVNSFFVIYLHLNDPNKDYNNKKFN